MDTGIVQEVIERSKIWDADALLENIDSALKMGQEHHVMGLLFQLVKQNTEDLKRLKGQQVVQVLKPEVTPLPGVPSSAFNMVIPSSEITVVSRVPEKQVSLTFIPSLGYAKALRNQLARLVLELDMAFGFDKKKRS